LFAGKKKNSDFMQFYLAKSDFQAIIGGSDAFSKTKEVCMTQPTDDTRISGRQGDGVPAGYVRIPWDSVVPGMEVFLLGLGEDQNRRMTAVAYGPNTVHSKWWLQLTRFASRGRN
jgi:hypothetical protein